MQEAVGRSFYVPYPECELQVTVPESSHETHTRTTSTYQLYHCKMPQHITSMMKRNLAFHHNSVDNIKQINIKSNLWTIRCCRPEAQINHSLYHTLAFTETDCDSMMVAYNYVHVTFTALKCVT